MNYWLLKSEPQTYSIDNLMDAKNQTAPWDGVRNYQARNFIRDEMKKGDLAFFYHSSCPFPGIVGIVEIVSPAKLDPTSLDPKSPYYDPKSTLEKPRWYMVDVKLKKKFKIPITLSELKGNPKLASMILLRPGNRLSVIPVSMKEWNAILG